jgi:hypothetical protein
MRRFYSILMILLFGLGPLSATLPASAESRLPSCCRRHGTHRCALPAKNSARESQASSESDPVFTTPLHCPSFPCTVAASTTPFHALVTPAAGLPVQFAQAHSPSASAGAAQATQLGAHTNRGPPASHIA